MINKKRIYEIIEKREAGDKTSILFDKFIVALILINILAIVLESFDNLQLEYGRWFYIVEVISVIIFTVEYILRILISDLKHEGLSRRKAIGKTIMSPMAIIDLLAILPFYIPMLIPFDLRFLRVLRLFRIFRIFKLNRYSKSLALLSRVIKNERENLLVTVFITLILILTSSTMMYYVESEAQPDQFPNIIASFWWAIATLTTVGYGDVYPITVVGKILSGTISFLGIGLVALPTGILSAGFMKEIDKEKNQNIICPHCNREIS